MSNLDFSYGVYDQSGKLLKGSLIGYGELARLLDAKWVPLYLESGKEGVLLGCRFIVQIIGGREERALFLAKYPIGDLNSDIITKFYERGVLETESLEEVSYEVLGLWDKGDIENIEQIWTPYGTYEFVIGKLLANEQVRVQSSNLFKGLSLLAKVAQELQPVLPLGFKLAVSISPVEADLLIRSEEPQASVDLSEDRYLEGHTGASIYDIFYTIYNKMAQGQFGDFRFNDRRKLAEELLKIALKEYPENIYKLYRHNLNRLFQLCLGNQTDCDLILIINHIVKENLDVSGIDNRTAVELIENLAPRVYGVDNYQEVDSFLIRLYEGISDSYKRNTQKFLLRENIFWVNVVSDAVKRIAEDRDRELLHLLARKTFNESKTAKQFNEGVQKCVNRFIREDALGLLKFALDELEWESGEGGEVLVKALRELLGYGI